MAELLTFDQLDEELILEFEALLIQRLAEEYPGLDTSPATVLRDLLIRPAALFLSAAQTQVDRLRRSSSLQEISSDPTLADDDVVDRLMSNYLVQRRAGTKATGRITLVLTDAVTTPIPADTRFTSIQGEVYRTIETQVGVTLPQLVQSATDVLIQSRPDGNYSMTVSVEAVEDGPPIAERDSRFTVDPEPPRLVDAYAESDFVGGTSAETNEQLVQRLSLGITSRTAGSRNQIEAMLRDRYPQIIDMSIIGMGDTEMVRDRDNLFGVSRGGSADIYVRTSPSDLANGLVLSCVLEDVDSGTWRIDIPRTLIPGFYRVESILPVGSTDLGSLEITEDVRGLHADDMPQIPDAAMAWYTPYQTATIRFIDTNTSGLQAGGTRDYQFSIRAMPDLADIQAFIMDRSTRSPTHDYLVRAPIPAHVSVHMTILRHPDDASPDIGILQATLVDRIHSLTFAHGRLSGAHLVDAVQSLLPSRSAVRLPIDLNGVFQLGGTRRYMHGTETLALPLTYPWISARTVCYMTSANAISLAVQTLT